MKLLFDENLSPRLPELLRDIYPDSTHVHGCGLGALGDAQVWEHAAAHGFVIVTKDSDFHALSVLRGHPPKVVWLCTGNCTVKHVENVLRTHSPAIHTFHLDEGAGVLMLA